ncbi:hypothetical protein [Neobacillus cucumis]|nr:hypothetical protein [Neobacillus cucumis]
MSKDELIKLLIQSNILEDLYSLNGELPNEALCLNNEKWKVGSIL